MEDLKILGARMAHHPPLARPSHAPQPELRHSQKKRTAARIESGGGDKKAERDDRRMERTKSGYDHGRRRRRRSLWGKTA